MIDFLHKMPDLLNKVVWTEVNGTWGVAIFTAILAGSIFLQLGALKTEQKKSRDDAEFQSYKQIDDIYYDIQKLIVSNPSLVNFGAEKSPIQVIQYNAFAFIVWNFIETIDDYISNEMKSGVNRRSEGSSLSDTWKVIVQYEGRLHKDWILDPGNEDKFKTSFYEKAKGIAKGDPYPLPPTAPGA